MQPDLAVFYLGPLGEMMPMATPEPDLESPDEVTAKVSVSVSAARSAVVQGFRRRWALEETWLLADDLSHLEAMFTGIVRGPFRILDPLKKNRLRKPAAGARNTSVWQGGSYSWAVTSGAGVVSPSTAVAAPAVEYTSVERRAVSYTPSTVMLWNAAGVGTRRLYPNGAPNADATYPRRSTDPVLPQETVTLSYWAKVAAGTATLRMDSVDAVGVVTAGVSTAIASGTWQRYSVTLTAPAGAVGVVPSFGADSADTVLHVGLGQLETGVAATSWQLGYGAPQVLIAEMGEVSPQYPFVSTPLTIQEL